VLPDRVTILSWVAERADEIDPERAEAAKKRAEARLAMAKADDIEYERARTALVKSLARLQVARSQFAGRVGRQRMPPPQA
jgi:F-type H+-transporting ATPase subunit epsilon